MSDSKVKTYNFGPRLTGNIAQLSRWNFPTFNIWRLGSLSLFTQCWLEDGELKICGYNFLTKEDKVMITKALRNFNK